MKRLALLSLSLFACCSITFSQKIDVFKWDKVSESDLAMTVYDKDSSANAVILGEECVVSFAVRNGGIAVTYDFYTRIKILKKAGEDYADIEIPYYTANKSERVLAIKAQTISPEGGKATRYKVERKDIFTEEVSDNYSVKKFTFPQVTPGAIIEYKYQLQSMGYFSLEDHYFQHEIPVKYSKYSIQIPEELEYIFLYNGNRAFDDKSEKDVTINLGAGYASIRGKEHTWIMKDVPAMVEESFITTMDDYLIKMRLQLAATSFGGARTPQFTTWSSLREELLKSTDFGHQYTKKSNYKKVLEACSNIIEADMDKKEKAKLLYEFVATNIEWNGYFGVAGNKDGNEVFEEKRGSMPEINLLLTGLLNEAGIEAHPVLISTRGHGKPYPLYPILSQFNAVLVGAYIGDELLLMDATSNKRAYNLIGIRCLNRAGWSMKGTDGNWVLIDPQSSKKIITLSASVTPDGTMEGQATTVYYNYQGVSMRDLLASEQEDGYFQERIKEDFPEIEITEHSFNNTEDINKRFEEKMDFILPEAAQVGGDMIYLSPFLNEGYDENPFKLEKREYPVDIAYPFSDQFVLNLQIPEGYKVEEVPASIKMDLIDGAGSFLFMSNELPNGTLQLISKLDFKRSYYEPQEYEYVKKFFDTVVEKHTSQIVLKKVEE